MTIKLITLQPKDTITSLLKKTAKDLFEKTNDPSFNIIEPLIILGETKLSSFANIKIKAIKSSLTFDEFTQRNKDVCFFPHVENCEIENLKETLCTKEKIDFNYKYFNLLKSYNIYPIVRLGNSFDKKVKIPKVIIDDYRIEIIEISVTDDIFYYNTLDTIHLSRDKVL